MNILLIIKLIFSTTVWASAPHVDETAAIYKSQVLRSLSSVEQEDKCKSNRAFGCVDYVESLGVNVIKVSIKEASNQVFDMRIRGACLEKDQYLSNAKNIELKNVHLDKYYSGIADFYVDGESLLKLCSKGRVPSSLEF